MTEHEVQVDRKALRRAWRRAEYVELWFQFRPRPRRPVFDVVEAAVLAANAAVDPEEQGETAFVEGVSDSELGPAALMSRTGGDLEVDAWFDAFANTLAAAGLAGTITAAPQRHLPQWLSGAEPLGPQLNAFVAFTRPDPGSLNNWESRRRWNVPGETTSRIVSRGVKWAAFEGADVYLRRNLFQIRTRTLDVTAPLADGLVKTGMAGAWYVHPKARRTTSIDYWFDGSGNYSLIDDSVPWSQRLDRLRAAVVECAEDADLAFIRYAGAYGGDWDNVDTAGPKLPGVQPYHLRYNRQLLAEFVPDAHGIQVLSDRHLAHAADLDNWRIEPLTEERYLVSAVDLDAWYAPGGPQPVTLKRARADFGHMILTLNHLPPRGN